MNDEELTETERLRQVASILAVGLLRLRKRAATAADKFRQESAEMPAAGLEVSPDTVLSVTNPVNGRESPTLGAPV